jgi:hypothetical protein
MSDDGTLDAAGYRQDRKATTVRAGQTKGVDNAVGAGQSCPATVSSTVRTRYKRLRQRYGSWHDRRQRWMDSKRPAGGCSGEGLDCTASERNGVTIERRTAGPGAVQRLTGAAIDGVRA